MDHDREASTAGDPTPQAGAGRGGPRSRALRRWDLEAGTALVLGSVALLAAVAVAVSVGWPALLALVAFLQVLGARAWVDHLEVPGPRVATGAALAVALVADVGIVVARLRLDDGESADALVALAPAAGVVFLAAVIAQLVRRDGRAGVLAGLVASVTGGVLVIGLAVLLPLESSAAGGGWVVGAAAAVALAGVVVGTLGWVRRSPALPSAALLLPVLLALVAGPGYVLGRVVAG